MKKSKSQNLRNFLDKIHLLQSELLGEFFLICGAVIIGGYINVFIQERKFGIFVGIFCIGIYLILKIFRENENKK